MLTDLVDFDAGGKIILKMFLMEQPRVIKCISPFLMMNGSTRRQVLFWLVYLF